MKRKLDLIPNKHLKLVLIVITLPSQVRVLDFKSELDENFYIWIAVTSVTRHIIQLKE